MAANDIWEVQLSYKVGSIPTMNVLHLREVESIVVPPEDLPQYAVESLAADYLNALMNLVSEDVKPVSTYVKKVPTQSIPLLNVLTGAEVNAGQRPGPPVPPQAALLFTIYTATLTKNGRGRIFVPGASSNDQVEGVVSDELFTLMQTASTFLRDLHDAPPPATGGKLRLCVYSRKYQVAASVLVVRPQVNMATIRSRRARPGAPS